MGMNSGFFTAGAAFNRPNDTLQYAIGDRVANATSGAAVLAIPNVHRNEDDGVRIERVRLRKTGPALLAASFCVHLFRLLPTISVNDNGAFNAAGVLALADINGYIGSFDVTMNRGATIGARGSGVPATGISITCESAGTSGTDPSLWAVIEALAAYQPIANETFTVTLEGAR